MKRVSALVLTAAFSLAGAGQAQSPGGPGPGLQGDQPMDVTADEFDRRNGGCLLVMTGSVEILQGGNRLRSPRVDVTYKPGGQGGGCSDQTDRIQAQGPVYYVTPTQNARGDAATFDADAETIIMTGNVVLTEDRNVLTGNRLTFNTRTNDARVESGGGSGRVRAVIFPNQRPAAAPVPARPAG